MASGYRNRIAYNHIAGYYQFHFLDAVPAFWPKSIVSFDLKPKKTYFEAAQLNQEAVPLFRLVGDQKEVHKDEFWISIDSDVALNALRLDWKSSQAWKVLMEGSVQSDARALVSKVVDTFRR